MSLTAKLLLYALMTIFVVSSAHAQTQGQGILCDTREQAIELANAGGGHEGIQTVNARTPHACAWVGVRFTDPRIIGETMMTNRLVAIIQVTISAFFANGVWFELAPSEQFTIVNLGEGA